MEYQYTYDFLSIILDKKIETDDKKIFKIISFNLKKIIVEIILYKEFEILNVLINYFQIDIKKIYSIIYSIILNIQWEKENYMQYSNCILFIEWIYKNNYEFFKYYIVQLFEKYLSSSNNLSNLHYYVSNFKILKLLNYIFIESDIECFNKYKITFINIVYKYGFIYHNKRVNKIYANFENLILLTNICTLNNNFVKKTYFEIFDNIITDEYSDLKISLKFIKYFNLSQNELKTHLENKKLNFIRDLIKTKSYDKINWFFDIISDYTKFIEQQNYIELFNYACKNSNVKIVKYIYDIIQICGYKIIDKMIFNNLNSLIYISRCNKSEDRDMIIYELINFGIKPKLKYSKYTQYYNNIKIRNNKDNFCVLYH